MLQQILTGQAKSGLLLELALIAYVYFLPAILAFLRAKKSFYLLLVLNLLLSPLQSLAARQLDPGLLAVQGHSLVHTLLVMTGVALGPGWIALLVWALLPGAPDARLQRAQASKIYDVAAALPLILWFVYGLLQLRPTLAVDVARILGGSAGLYQWLQFFSLLAVAAFDLLLVYLLVVRDRPILKSRSLWARFIGFLGTFAGVGILQLPVAPLALGMQMLTAVLVGIGSAGSALVLWRLGKSFSILPEARALVTSGPYGFVRHPLYAMEIFTIMGTALQFAQPAAGLIGAFVVALLVLRSHYEEQVLTEAYPEYAAYKARTRRFIPGVI